MSNSSAHDDKDFSIDAMIEASSLGSAGAKRLRNRTSDAELDRLYLEKTARELSDANDPDRSAAELKLALGDLASTRGELSTAHDYYIRAAEIGQEQGRPNIAVFTRLGELAASTGDFTAAEHWLRKAAELSLTNLAELALRQGDQSASEQWIARARTLHSQ